MKKQVCSASSSRDFSYPKDKTQVMKCDSQWRACTIETMQTMKKCAALVLAIFSLSLVKAQDKSTYSVGCIEGEVGAGVVFGTDKLGFDKINPGAVCYAEIRHNFRKLPLDAGLHVAGTIFHRESDKAGQLKFKSWSFIAVTDYNFLQKSKVSFFAGAGVGYASSEHSAPIVFDDSQPNWGGFSTGGKKGAFCFMPRAGVELFHHLRVTAAYKLADKANSHFDLTIGVAFGGGLRKR